MIIIICTQVCIYPNLRNEKTDTRWVFKWSKAALNLSDFFLFDW